MNPVLFLTLRYLLSVRGSTLLISLISLFGVFLGVSAIILTLGVFTGFQDTLKEKILSTTPHVIISNVGDTSLSNLRIKIQHLKEVKTAIPFTLYSAIMTKGENVQPVTVKAVDFYDPEFVETIGRYMEEGDIKDLIVGKGISEVLDLKVGSLAVLVSPMGIRTPTGFVPKTREVSIGGIFYTGTYDKDFVVVYMDRKEAKRFFKRGFKFEGIEVYLKNPYLAQEVKEKIKGLLGEELVVIRSWIDLNKPLFNALQLEKLALFLILLLMVLVGSFNITSLLFVKTKEKMRDIAVLKTFGMRTSDVQKIFVGVGMSIGFVGALLGIGMSYLVGFIINEYRLIRVPEEVYMMSHIPVHIELWDVVATFVGTMILSFLSSLIPARRASREKVVRVLRNE